MSATSEELAAQAEQLQSSIAYFRTDDHGAAPRERAAPARPAAAAAAKPAAPKAAQNGRAKPAAIAVAPAKSNGAGPHGRPNGKANGGGFAFDLVSGGADAHDAEFERV
jgi:methyl-accepting chemotaxis protein